MRKAVPGTVANQARISPPIEVTDLLQRGLSQLSVTIKPGAKEMLYGRNEERRFTQITSISELAFAYASAEFGQSYARYDGLLVCDEFIPIAMKYWSITYRFADGLASTTTISWMQPNLKIGWRPFSALGQSYADQYEVAYQGSVAKIEKAQEAGQKRPVRRRRNPPPQK